MPEFEALARERSLKDRVSQALLSAISAGDLRPGEKLPTERELSEQLQVSQTVVRDTIRSLEATGILARTGPRRVEVVAVPSSRVAEAMELYLHGARSQKSVGTRDIIEVRVMIDMTLARLATERATPHDLEALDRELDLMTAETTAERAVHHDAEFHRLVAVATHNELFATLEEAFSATVRQIRLALFDSPQTISHVVEKHRAVVAALRKRDPVAATEAMLWFPADPDED